MAKKNDEQKTTETIETTVVSEVINNVEDLTKTIESKNDVIKLLETEKDTLYSKIKELEDELLTIKSTPSSDRAIEYKYPLNKKVIFPTRYVNLIFSISEQSGNNGISNLYKIYASATGELISNVEEHLLEPANVFSHE